MNIFLLKAILSVADFVGRTCIFNWQPPPVGKIVRNIPYGNHTLQILDLLIPPSEPPYPIVVYFHGGGFLAGSKESYTRICRTLASHHYLACNVNYRLAPKCNFPAQLHDVAAALAWVIKNADEYGGDTTKIFLAGDSSGAYLTSWYATALYHRELFDDFGISNTMPKESLKGTALFYGIYDLGKVLESNFPFMKLLMDFLTTDPETQAARLHLSSPIRSIACGFPPVFLCAGERDPLFSQSLALEKALKEHGVSHTSLFFPRDRYPDAHHAFLNFYYKRCSKIAMVELIKFLNVTSKNNH